MRDAEVLIERAEGQSGAFNPPLVIPIHGILTHAKWYNGLSEILADRHIHFRLYDFGYYRLHKFLFEHFNKQELNRFYKWYGERVAEFRLDPDNFGRRPSMIAHSFGTYILGYTMLKYPDLKLDKVILCGSILPRDFDWATLIAREQVNLVRNEYGAKDVWTRRVGHFVARTGSSGNEGFTTVSRSLEQERFDYFEHSDYFDAKHITTYWLPFLGKPPLSFHIRHGREIEDPAAFQAILEAKIKEIDSFYYGPLAGYSSVAPDTNLITTWINQEPDIYTFLVDKHDKLRGYIDAIPVEDDLFERARQGRAPDNEIRARDIVPYSSNRELKVYLTSIAIAPGARKIGQGLFQETLERLINGYLDKLIYYARYRNIRVSELVAVGWTDEGIKFCELFGMKQPIRDGKPVVDRDGHPVYWISFKQEGLERQQRMFPRFGELLSIYRGLD